MNACACGLSLVQILPSIGASGAAGQERSACAELPGCLREETLNQREERSRVGSWIVLMSGVITLVGALLAWL